MSEPVKLQSRLQAEFAEAPSRPAHGRPDGEVTRDASASAAPARESHAAIRAVIAGAGLLCAVLVLITGMASGFYIAAAGLGLTGIAGAMFLFLSRRPPAGIETVHDRGWERSETSEILSAIHDVLGDIIVTRTLDGRILRANAVLGALTGVADVEGRTLEALGLSFRSQASAHRYDVDVQTASGMRIYSWHDVTVRDPASGELVVQSIARDVTEERRAEGEREKARQRAEAASAAKSRLLATVSHEIRTPLSGILGMSHLLGQTRLTAEQKNYLAGMRQSGHALVQLVDDLLDFSSIEAGRFQLRPSEEPVRPMLESVVEMLSPRAHEKGIEIGSFVSADVPGLLLYDAARLRQVLYNVVGNAVKFTHTGGVLLETMLDGDAIVIRVTDTGPGMRPDEQARIFEEFEQTGSAAQRSGGTGLGLAISARILSEAGGALTLESAPGRGSTFTIRMPVEARLRPSRGTRKSVLRGSLVFLLAPAGPASAALVRTIGALGGACHLATSVEEAENVMRHLAARGETLTDIIVDNRLAGVFRRELADMAFLRESAARRIYLVNPEDRGSRAIGKGEGYDSWLIRPLRERSLVEVLRGRMKGVEVRDAINDNRPILKDPPPVAPDPRAAASSGIRILLAEDDPVNAMLVRSVLERAGHTVRHVPDYPALVSALGGATDAGPFAPELIVTDLGMPGGEGQEMIARIVRCDYGNARLPVMVLTADNRTGLAEELLSIGADAVLAKPADPARLLGEIARIARRARA
ncbi:hybrid sensor histidine kinase/response regulator [Shinella sumterensis]|uniref:histidine kinase n=1 Tax=Shinella sumterensis TaxID=1967501 RepID=A0AA50H3R4_9HYPH|nr:hybrid sensor histidine kinase/response regulator [Shinella sumterensis]WLR96764.1 ATP-binding protein [Shinella sumterensis]